MIVDLQALDFIDCAALRALVRAQRQARQAGGEVLLAAPAGTLARVLGLTGLGDVLGVHASVASALASAAPWRASGDPRGTKREPLGGAGQQTGRWGNSAAATLASSNAAGPARTAAQQTNRNVAARAESPDGFGQSRS